MTSNRRARKRQGRPRILALLISCGLRRAELVGLEVDRIQQREGRWVIPDLVGKGNRLRIVTVPAAVKVRIDTWIAAAKISKAIG